MGFDVGTPPGEPGSTLAGLDLVSDIVMRVTSIHAVLVMVLADTWCHCNHFPLAGSTLAGLGLVGIGL